MESCARLSAGDIPFSIAHTGAGWNGRDEIIAELEHGWEESGLAISELWISEHRVN